MKKVFVVFAFLVIYVGFVFPNADVSIVIGEQTLNKFLSAIGVIEKVESFNVSGISGKYKWTVENAKIKLLPNKARFEANVTVSFLGTPVQYSTPAYGEVSILYDHDANKINIKVNKVAFDVTFNLMGRNVKITEVDISKFYQIAFSFSGPKPFEAEVSAPMPDGSQKSIKIESVPVLSIQEGKIVVGVGLNYIPKQ